MKLYSLELSGFRGFKNKLEVDFAKGFTIISGRNGAGKSTIFDAIEFALTGQIEKYQVEKASKESVSDYLWWRGQGVPDEQYVEVKFIDEEGKIHSIKRSRVEGIVIDDLTAVENMLCKLEGKPEGALRQACKTTIIRDEWISAYSLDLNDTDRFELVKNALGTAEGLTYNLKSKEVVGILEASAKKAEQEYEHAKEQLNNLLVELSELRNEANLVGDVSNAMEYLRKYIPDSPQQIKQSISYARRYLVSERSKLSEVSRVLEQLDYVDTIKKELHSPEYREQKDFFVRSLEDLRSQYIGYLDNLNVLEHNLNSMRELDEITASLATLVNIGQHVGLHDGKCPLCAAARTKDEFHQGLMIAKSRLSGIGQDYSELEQKIRFLKSSIDQCVSSQNEFQQKINILNMREYSIKDTEQKNSIIFEELSLDREYLYNSAMLKSFIEKEKDRLIEIDKNILTLESSQVIELIAELEGKVAFWRSNVDVAAENVGNLQRSINISKSIDQSVRRSSAEIIDERLALISPLLSELYQRLRPHSEWKSIKYNIRGDVKRFLSLMVGDDLNPQFIFSSGQRRAAGLAFLLSVHLSRLWCNWKTLILDDPVQHIDDFRALHLVEVLSALGNEGQQIICAIEDDSLADLMCRKFRNSEDSPGVRYSLDYRPTGNIATRIPIIPMEKRTITKSVRG